MLTKFGKKPSIHDSSITFWKPVNAHINTNIFCKLCKVNQNASYS